MALSCGEKLFVLLRGLTHNMMVVLIISYYSFRIKNKAQPHKKHAKIKIVMFFEETKILEFN